MVFQAQWNCDVILREMKFDPQLLDDYAIDRVVFAHRHATDEELRRSRRLMNLAHFGFGRPTGPRENASRGWSKIVDSWSTVAWALSVEHGDPQSACKQAMPDGRLALRGTCIAGGIMTVQVTAQSSTSKPFVADIVYEDP
jgi:hypothetical protein